MAISGSGCSAIGIASFSSSAALRLAGAEGGGAGVGALALVVVLDWPRAALPKPQSPSAMVRAQSNLNTTAAAPPGWGNGLGRLGLRNCVRTKAFILRRLKLCQSLC